jgi:hypothetical protein
MLKEKYSMLTKLIICFDPRKSVEKTKYNQLQIHPFGIVIETEGKRSALDYEKLIGLTTNEWDVDSSF